VLDAGIQSFVNDVLDGGPVEDRQHFLRDCLGCGQDPGTKPGHRQYRFP
jgi:hypothetical protein